MTSPPHVFAQNSQTRPIKASPNNAQQQQPATPPRRISFFGTYRELIREKPYHHRTRGRLRSKWATRVGSSSCIPYLNTGCVRRERAAIRANSTGSSKSRRATEWRMMGMHENAAEYDGSGGSRSTISAFIHK